MRVADGVTASAASTGPPAACTRRLESPSSDPVSSSTWAKEESNSTHHIRLFKHCTLLQD